MSITQIKACQCARFPAGSAINASERINEKANIQIRKNNELLNCNKALPKTDLVRRVYSGTQNRLRSINGYKLIQQKCEAGATCIFSEKSASDYWIVENSVSDDNYKYTRITTNPTVEVLVEGPLNKAVLQSLAATYGNNDFLNPTEIIIGTEVTEISSDLFDGITTIRLTTLGVKTYLMNKCLIIRDNAFKECTNLTSLTIPDSVITIGFGAFQVCENLTTTTIPNSVITISGGAFYNCGSLTSINIPNSVTTIGADAFAKSKLTSIIIGNSVTTIGAQAFLSCESLASVTLSNSVTTIGAAAFGVCKILTSIIIPASVTSIGTSTFADCIALSSVTFKKGINVNIDTPNDVWFNTPVAIETATFPTGGTAAPSTGDNLIDITNIDLSAASGDVVFTA